MKSDTPRTDRETYDVVESRLGNVVATNLVDSDFARTLERELNAARAENTRLRAALANSDQPCAYCTLPADEIAKCPSGFPGCGRMDDAMGCPELGAAVQLAAPTPLPRPDKPGWWWEWSDEATPPRWLPVQVVWPPKNGDGQWLPSTPPPAPKEETK